MCLYRPRFSTTHRQLANIGQLPLMAAGVVIAATGVSHIYGYTLLLVH